MPVELDPESLKEYASKAVAWAKANPLVAGLAAGAVLVVFLFGLLVVSVTRSTGASVSSETFGDPESAAEPNLCARLGKLERLGRELEQRSTEQQAAYQTALVRLFEELTREKPSPNDLAVLFSLAGQCSELTNADLGWLVGIEARLLKGLWPKYPLSPPQSPQVRQRLAAALQRSTRLTIALPDDPSSKHAWLLFAAELSDPPPLLLGVLLPDGAPPQAILATYQALVLARPGSTLVAAAYRRLGLLSRPISVLDTKPVPLPSSLPGAVFAASQPNLERGPEGTLFFLGVLSGEDCAIALNRASYPPLWIRTCQGLVPRRLPEGELFLLGTTQEWLPLLVDDAGEIHTSGALIERVPSALLTAFVAAAPRFMVELGGARPIAHALTAREPDELGGGKMAALSFASPELTSTRRPGLIAFAKNARAKLEKGCPSIERERCRELRGSDPEDRCELGVTACALFPGGARLRWASTRTIHPEPCLKEYGRESDCKRTETFGVLLDVRTPTGRGYSPHGHVIVARSLKDGE